MQDHFYELVRTAFGTIGIVWWQTTTGPRIRKILLDTGLETTEEAIRRDIPDIRRLSCSEITGLCDQICHFLDGRPVVFDLKIVALELCRQFQRSVLLAEYGIPRGRVSTYGRIAKYVGAAGASRAVGTALAKNPFPIIIPCHRAVRADGEIGEYQGGSAMKRALLKMEGVDFVEGKVVMKRVYY